MEDNLQLPELRKLAKERGLKNISKLKKDELKELLQSTESLESQDEIQEPTIERVVKEDSFEDRKTIETKEDFVSGNGVYKVTNEGDNIVEGILEVLPDG